MLSVYSHGLKVPNSLSNVVILWNLKSNNWFFIALGDCIQTPPCMSQVLFCTAWLESQLSRGYAVVKSYLSWTGITRSCKAYVSKWLENSSSASRNWKGRSGLEISPACLRPSFLYRAQKCCSSIFFSFFSFSWHAASEQKFDMDCAFKNHGSFLPFFQISHLETLLVQNQEKLAGCYPLGPLGKVYFWVVMKSCTRCLHDHSSQMIYLFIYLQVWGTATYVEALLTP